MRSLIGKMIVVCAAWAGVGVAVAGDAEASVPAALDGGGVRAFLTSYCTRCHGENKQKGKLALHQMPPLTATGDALEKWRLVAEQLEFHDMPPEDAKQPPDDERARVLGWIRAGLRSSQRPGSAVDPRMCLPEFGNYVDHQALFDEPAGPVVPAAPSLWRLRPESYQGLIDQITADTLALTRPFSVQGGAAIRDYAALSVIDEPAVELLLRNADLVIEDQGQHAGFAAIVAALDASRLPDEAQRRRALDLEFHLALRRNPRPGEAAKFLRLWERNLQTSGHPIGSRATLAAVLLLPEVLFRYELGAGELDALGRRRLTPTEIARAVSLALREQVDAETYAAGVGGGLATRADVAAAATRLLDAPTGDNPRLLQFFREFFDYEKATTVFKEVPERGVHDAELLVSDLDALIGHVLAADEQVLRRLLTTREGFVNWCAPGRAGGMAKPATSALGFAAVYGLPPDWKWTAQQPFALPGTERAGVLTHPAWLVAHSLNTANDPVRRGKWVRTHLLGGTVPDVPIGVAAKIPEDPHRTLRLRLAEATSGAECWRCHRKMDPLGLPFEQFNHLGHFRFNELGRAVDARGQIDRTGDAQLDGTAVANPPEMMAALAGSARVEQVFVRYAFRYFLGRNETLGDAATLQDAWRAYRGSGGSFKALVTSLLTSDSFLLRSP